MMKLHQFHNHMIMKVIMNRRMIMKLLWNVHQETTLNLKIISREKYNILRYKQINIIRLITIILLLIYPPWFLRIVHRSTPTIHIIAKVCKIPHKVVISQEAVQSVIRLISFITQRIFKDLIQSNIFVNLINKKLINRIQLQEMFKKILRKVLIQFMIRHLTITISNRINCCKIEGVMRIIFKCNWKIEG